MWTRAEFLRSCAHDRDFLLTAISRRLGFRTCPVPADVIDDVLEVLLRLTVIPRAMPRDTLGYIDFDLHHVGYNTRIPTFALHDTYVEGVVISTKGHELGHSRLGHELELREEKDTLTLPLFVESIPPMQGVPILCTRTHDPVHAAREAAANTYASVFLVPEYQLMQFEEARWVERCCRDGRAVTSQVLWDLARRLGAHFRVTPSLMARRFEDLGWIVKRGPNLSILPEPWLPLAGLELSPESRP